MMQMQAEFRPAASGRALKKLQEISTPLVIVVAPAGYGKGALLAAFAEQHGQRVNVETPGDKFSLIDDRRPLDEQRVREVLAQAREGRRTVVASANLPHFDWLSLQIGGLVSIIGPDDLRLTLEETGQLLQAVAPDVYDIDKAKALHEDAAGWSAAILAGAQIMRRWDGPGKSAMPSIDGAQAQGFFASFIDAFLPEDIVDFLAQSAVFEFLSRDLIENVMGAEAAAQFLRCRDEFMVFAPSEREGFWHLPPVLRRYFRKSRPIDAADVSRMLLESVDWHEKQGAADLAIDYLIQLERADEAADMFARHAQRIRRQHGDSPKMLGWLERIEKLGGKFGPELQLWYVRGLAFSMRLDEAGEMLDRVMPTLDPADKRMIAFAERLQITVVARRNNAEMTAQLSQDWLDRWADDDALQAAGVAIMYALVHAYRFDERSCRRMLLLARQYSIQSSNEAGNVWAMGIEALTELDGGRAHLALDIIERARDHAMGACGRNSTVAKILSLIESAIQLELGHYDRVRDALAHGHESSSYGLPRLHLAAQEAMAGYAEHSKGANGALMSVHQKGIHGWFYSQMGQLLSVRILIRAGRVSEAVARFDAVRDALSDRLDERMEVEFQTVEAWIRLAEGKPEEAKQIVMPLLDYVEVRGQRRWLASLMLLRASCEWSLGEMGMARRCFSRAMGVAASGQLVNTVLDLQWALRGMIAQMAIDDEVGTQTRNFMAEVMSRMGLETPEAEEVAPLEKLTPRESEVLMMLDSGMIAKDIAARLDMSVCTLKWHIKNIYGKLSVRNRTGAITVARRFGLI